MAGLRPRGRRVCSALALSFAVFLSACASPPSQVRSGVVLEGEWTPIPVEQADLNLPGAMPRAFNTLHRRSDTDLAVQDLYGFDGSGGIKGYIVTIRNPHSELPALTRQQMLETRLFRDLLRGLPQARQFKLEIDGTYSDFTNGPPHSLGHYTTARSKIGLDDCFVALVGMLLVEDKAVELSPDAIDTQILAVLCGRRIDEAGWVAALEKTDLAGPANQLLTLRAPQ